VWNEVIMYLFWIGAYKIQISIDRENILTNKIYIIKPLNDRKHIKVQILRNRYNEKILYMDYTKS
jgi:hypothetical protein